MYFFIYTIYKKIQFFFLQQSDLNMRELDLTLFIKPVFQKVTVEDISFEILLDPNNGLVDTEIYTKGVWEEDILLEIKKHITRDSVCLDIGSNIGQHALYMSQIAVNGTVYAFEPVPKLAQQIQQSVVANNIHNITVCHFGLSNKNETRDIYLNNLNMGNTTFKKRLGASDVIQVETKLFDDFWGDTRKIDFIKIDIEGYEYYCLLGMKKTLEKYHPTMIIEFSPIFYNKMNISSADFLQYIFGFGYKIYDLDDTKKKILSEGIQEFIERTPSQTNILCIAKS